MSILHLVKAIIWQGVRMRDRIHDEIQHTEMINSTLRHKE